MNRIVVFALFACTLLVGADEPKKDETARDVEKLQGTWILISIESNGDIVAPKTLKGRKLIVKGEGSVFMDGETIYGRSTQKLAVAKNPRQIDITQTEGQEKRKVTKGIYKLDGDELSICYVYRGEGRPSEFKAGKGSGCILLKLRHEKQ